MIKRADLDLLRLPPGLEFVGDDAHGWRVCSYCHFGDKRIDVADLPITEEVYEKLLADEFGEMMATPAAEPVLLPFEKRLLERTKAENSPVRKLMRQLLGEENIGDPRRLPD